MNSDRASLERLKDIAEPSAVSWWPPAIGWWMLLGALLVVAAVCAVRAFRSWRASAYRRAALSELQTAQSNAAISEILKRTALAVSSRTEVASLSGETWCQWLGKTSGMEVTDPLRQCLTSGIFHDAEAGNHGQLKEFASRWIRGHKNQTEDREGGLET